jgi:hypothetical protein
MGENIEPKTKKLTGKDDILHTITAQLLNGLTMLKDQLGNKKYEKRIKKAAKFLVEGIKNTPPKKQAVTAKKTVPKKKKDTKNKTAAKATKAKTISETPTAKKVAKNKNKGDKKATINRTPPQQ